MAENNRSFPERLYKFYDTFDAIKYPISPMSMIENQLKADSEAANGEQDNIRPEDGNLNN